MVFFSNLEFQKAAENFHFDFKNEKRGKNVNAPHNNLSLTNKKGKRVVGNDGKLRRNE